MLRTKLIKLPCGLKNRNDLVIVQGIMPRNWVINSVSKRNWNCSPMSTSMTYLVLSGNLGGKVS